MKNKKDIKPILEPIRNKYNICADRSCIYYTFDFNKDLKVTGCCINENPQVCRKIVKLNELLDNI